MLSTPPRIYSDSNIRAATRNPPPTHLCDGVFIHANRCTRLLLVIFIIVVPIRVIIPGEQIQACADLHYPAECPLWTSDRRWRIFRDGRLFIGDSVRSGDIRCVAPTGEIEFINIHHCEGRHTYQERV
eukprot:GEMP01079103.1.p1 GENE.GEMP01079103.1~~GEMP01079103.1.p1  ORF type:complete len:128 (+),score=11.07 GEMP01079103.1:680-1063(+)